MIEVISYITTVQLFLLGVVLLPKRKKSSLISSRLLSMFMISNGLLLLFFNLEEYFPVVFPKVNFCYFLLSPLLFLYAKSLTTQDFKLRSIHLLHFTAASLPFGYFVAMAALNYLFESSAVHLVKRQTTEFVVSNIVLHLQVAAYLIFTFNVLYRYRLNLKDMFSAVEKIDLTWLIFVLMAFAMMWLADVIHFMLFMNHALSSSISKILIFFSLLINFIFANTAVYYGLKQPQSFLNIQESAKSYKSGLPNEECILQAERLKRFMEDNKPYLEPTLTIKDLSDRIGIHPKYLSQIINSQFNQNFYDFINLHRINEAKNLIISKVNSPVTILEILYESGFNSKSVFNQSFKKIMGCTPSEFKKRLVPVSGN